MSANEKPVTYVPHGQDAMLMTDSLLYVCDFPYYVYYPDPQMTFQSCVDTVNG